MTFIDTLLTYARAGYPAVAVVSHEESRVLGELARAAERAERRLATWSLTQGWIGLGRAQAQADPSGAVKAIQEFPGPCFAVLKDFHPYLDSPEVVRTIRDALPILKGEEKTLILLSPRLALPMELQKDVALVDFALPDREALAGLLDRLLTDARADGGPEIPVTHREALLDAARGLTLNEAENALSLALVRHARLDAQAVETVQAEKTALVRKSGLLEVCRPVESVQSIGGLGLLKAWLQLQGRLFQDAEAARAYGFTDKDLPRGVCLIGVPGTGKSLTAQAVAASWGLPLLRLDMSRILGSLVSQSEQQMRQALDLAEAMAPAVLWADELEKALAGSEASGVSDGGVMARLVGSFLTWLQERTAALYVVATVNRIGGASPGASPPRALRRLLLLRSADARRSHRGPPDPPGEAAAGPRAVPGGRDPPQAGRVHSGRSGAGGEGSADPRFRRGRSAPRDRGSPGRRRPGHAGLGDPGRRDPGPSGVGQTPRPARQRAAC